ncbi:MAG TPA: DUF3553 domain-containing protein [Dongiaceae bacterium]|nr:DUF3553 domain-containing protein [Dongiaceae bacterium]
MTATPLAPGSFVRHPHRPDWGLGQVQSVVGKRVTVNFEGAGKVVIISDRIALEPDDPAKTAKD